MVTAFQHFVDYAELDQKIDRLTQERVDLTKKIEKNLAQRDAFVHANQATCAVAHSLRKEMDFLELELRSISQKLSHTEKLLQATSSVKEFAALQHEVDSLIASRSTLEESGLELLSKWEAAQEECDRVLAAEPAELKLFEQEDQELKERAQYVETLKNAYITKKAVEEKSVDAELLASYLSMKEKVANPAVPLINGQCSACFYSASPKDVSTITQGTLVRCKDCYRFLYTHQPVKKDDT